MSRAPNMRVEYVDADTGESRGFCDFHDPGFRPSNGQWVWPSFRCGQHIPGTRVAPEQAP